MRVGPVDRVASELDGPRQGRRAFLLRLLGGAALLPPTGGLVWWLSSAPGENPSAGRSTARDPATTEGAGLPRRVIALRSLGGAFRFDPPGLLVESDLEVTWLNMGDFHTTTAFHPENDAVLPGGVPLRIPEGAEPWHSGVLGLTAGTEFTHRFEVPGVYDYFCQPHYGFGMVGRIIVGGPGRGPAVGYPVDELLPAARTVMPPVDEILENVGVTFEWVARVNGVLHARVNGGAAAAYARVVAEGLPMDRAIRGLVDDDMLDALAQSAERFSQAVRRGNDYEALVRGADELKRLLSDAHLRG